MPVLGICYGMQLIALLLGGKVVGGRAARVRAGHGAGARPAAACSTASPPAKRCPVWMSHGDRVETLPPGFEVIAESANCPAAAVAAPDRNFWGVQFHPEVVHTPRGEEILANFLFRICGAEPSWTMAGFVSEAVAAIAARVGADRAARSAACRAASTRRWRRCWCCARSATG